MGKVVVLSKMKRHRRPYLHHAMGHLDASHGLFNQFDLFVK